ncbi:hypothetical protein PLICRDRAFT_51181 [Plicaturopsis crispa FD-325 SS-3]|nr:hypothetical protein PLICRDRAFT_51181 [Plicaturopsis crispa FD-325 SS-3]
MYTEPYSHQELSARVREWSERTPPRSTLPTSSAREEEWAPRTQPSHPIASSSASAYLHAYRADVEAAARPAPHVYEVAPGVNSNGTMNANYPKVREYLDLMTHSPEARTPPPEECAMVYVLLALDTYEHPTHPAHWMFWGRDRKARTAAAVDLVYCAWRFLSYARWC